MDKTVKENKKIDVIIPVYNGRDFIMQAIKSVNEQTYLPEKIIVINDGSTDDTESIVLENKKNSKIPIIYIKKENGGPNSARNVGIKISDGNFLAFLDADDEWHKNKLEEQIKIFDKSEFKKLGLVYCGAEIINGDGLKNNLYDINVDKNIKGFVFKKILQNNKIVSSASGVLIKSECFKKAGYFDEKLKAGEDWDMWLRLAKYYEFDYVDQILSKIRTHDNNTQKDGCYMFTNTLIFYDKWAKKLNRKLIPEFWMDNISGKALKRLPRIDFLLLVNKKITKRSRQNIFFKTNGSFYLYVILFLFKKILKLF